MAASSWNAHQNHSLLTPQDGTVGPLGPLLQVYLQEYDKLKDEQIMRIKFRDGMIPLTLAAIGTLVSFALAKEEYHTVLLIVPPMSVILGWLYAINDEKVSHIGKYLRVELADCIALLLGDQQNQMILGWEVRHRDDALRKWRKDSQYLIDLLAFVLPGILSTVLFVCLVWKNLGCLSLIAVPYGLGFACWALINIQIFARDRTKGK